jgi:periplasmic divalent cation tolerance protein
VADLVIVLTTVPAGDAGDAIVRALVDERLAACVNILPPMFSTYRWQGAVARESEQQLVIKTMRTAIPALEARLRELHPYDVPEFVVLDITGASDAYASWVRENVGGEIE